MPAVEIIEAEIRADPSRAIRDLERFNSAIDKVTKKTRSATIDLDTRDTDRKINRNTNALGGFTRATVAAGGAASRATSSVVTFGSGISNAGGAAAGVGSSGMNAFSGGIASMVVKMGLFMSIIPYVLSALNALGAGAFAVGGQLSYLGGLVGALPGLFVAAAGGIGALLLGLKGVGGAMKAYTAAAKEAENSTRSQANLARERANAERNLAAALKSVGRAQKDVLEAEKMLTQARADAAENLVDLRESALLASFSETEAVLALEDAQNRLLKVQKKTAQSAITLTRQTDDFTGKVYEVAFQSVDKTEDPEEVDSSGIRRDITRAEIEVERAKRRTARAQEDLNEAERKGIDGSRIVQDALRRQENALDAVTRAMENVADAQDRVKRTTEQSTAAQRNLADALAALTPAGRRFVTFLKDEWLPAWKKVQQAAQEGLLGDLHLEIGLRSIMDDILPVLEKRMRDFGHTVGVAFENFGKGLAERAEIFDRVLISSNKALGSLLRGFADMGFAILTIADQATPLTEWLAGGFANKMTEFRDKMDEWAANGKLTKFFQKVQKTASQVGRIISNIAQGIGSLITGSEPLGTTILDSIERITKSWKEGLGSPEGQARVQQWFESLREPLRTIKNFIGQIGTEVLNIGGPNNGAVNNFSSVLGDIKNALPGIFQGLRDISTIIHPIAEGVRLLAEGYDKLRGIEKPLVTSGDVVAAEWKANAEAMGGDWTALYGSIEAAQAAAEKEAKRRNAQSIIDTAATNKTNYENYEGFWGQTRLGWDFLFGEIKGENAQAARDMQTDWEGFKREQADNFHTIGVGAVALWGLVTGENSKAVDAMKIRLGEFEAWWNDDTSAVGKVRVAMRSFGSGLLEGIRNAIQGIKDLWEDFRKNFSFDLRIGDWGKEQGDGPGKLASRSMSAPRLGGAATPGVGTGSAGAMARAAVSSFPGARITSAYRDPARNIAVGGSPNSFHTDSSNPAHDIAGTPAQMNDIFGYLFNQYGGNIREMIYGRTKVTNGVLGSYTRGDHWDHVHVAHKGGEVSRSWARMPGDRPDERTARLQVGEQVIPARMAEALRSGGSGSTGGGGLSSDQFEAILEKVLAKAKAPVNIDQTFMEKQDARLVGAELAWRLR